jgi:hypothetical protein
MKKQFEVLLDLIKEPLNPEGGVKTDNSIRFIYPSEKEFDFQEYLLDKFLPFLDAKAIPYRLLNLNDFLFEILDDETIKIIKEDEFDDYRWMKQGLSKRIEAGLQRRLAELAAEIPGGTVIVCGTISLYPLIRFGEVLKAVRDLNCRIVLSHPGTERDGKTYFMDQQDSGNYLTVKLV